MNPYEPPQPAPVAPWQPSDKRDPIVVRVPNTSELMLKGANRFNELNSTGKGYLPTIKRRFPLILIVVFYVWFAWMQQGVAVPARFRKPLLPIYLVHITFVTFLLFSIMSSWLFRCRLKQALSKSLEFGGDVVFKLAENGAHLSFPNCESLLLWNAFTKAALFDDGALLVQAQAFYWLPYQAIEGEHGQDRIIHLLRSKIPNLVNRRKHNVK